MTLLYVTHNRITESAQFEVILEMKIGFVVRKNINSFFYI